MFLEIESNPNVERSFDMVYRDISPTRELYCIKYNINGEEQPVQITGWNAETNSPCSAYACKVEESGDGIALLIFGGTGGCLLYTSPSPRDRTRSRMPSSA